MGTKQYWLNARRIRVYPRIFLTVYAGILVYWLIVTFWLAPQPPTSLRNDFAVLWTAGQMILDGRASETYDPDLTFAAQKAYLPEHEIRLYWFYPPQLLFLVGPLAALPFLAAFFLWTGASLASLALSLRALVPHPATIWLLLASPALFWILRWGQTGMLAAALLGGAIFFMSRGQRFSAGLLIGLLAFKPHFGLLLPFALIAGRQWRVLAVATATTLLIAGASALAFGVDIWSRFFEAMNIAFAVQFDGTLPPYQMASLYAALITLGLPLGFAFGVQALLGVTVLVVVVLVWHRLGPSPLAGATLAAGTVLVTSHVFGYDLVLMAPAIAILAWDGVQRGWLRGERASYVLLWTWPWLAEVIEDLTGCALGVAGSLLLFALAIRRCRVMGGAQPS